MTADSKLESRSDCDGLSESDLDRVVAGSDYTNTMQMMSQILQMLEATSKAIVGNIR